MREVKKAVIPVAGFGTRFLPATKSTPKEMLPIIDKPIIHYIVEEAVKAGIETVIFVTGRHKRAIEDYFDHYPELENQLLKNGRKDIVEMIRGISNMAEFVYVRQKEQLGLGHAILTAKHVVGDEPFAVMLGDELIINQDKPAIGQLIETYYKFGKSVVGTMSVPKEDVSKYGIVDGREIMENIRLITSMIEKPKVEEARSNSAIIGRYVLTQSIFQELENTPIGKGGELQLTDAMVNLLRKEAIYSKDIEGIRHDTGNKLGYLKAILDFALLQPDIRDDLKEILFEKCEKLKEMDEKHL